MLVLFLNALTDNRITLKDIKNRFVDFKCDVLAYMNHEISIEDTLRANQYIDLAEVGRPHCDGSKSSRKKYPDFLIKFPAIEYLYKALWCPEWPNEVLDSGDAMNSYYGREKALNFSRDGILSDIDQNNLKQYAFLTGTIGNYIPVPAVIQLRHAGCGRGTLLGQDRWDRLMELTIESEKAWYKNWCSYFGSISKFIKDNYLQSYFEDDEQIKIIDGVSPSEMDPSMYIEYLNACIIARGNHMIAALEEKIAGWENSDWPEWIDEQYRSREKFLELYCNTGISN